MTRYIVKIAPNGTARIYDTWQCETLSRRYANTSRALQVADQLNRQSDLEVAA